MDESDDGIEDLTKLSQRDAEALRKAYTDNKTRLAKEKKTLETIIESLKSLYLTLLWQLSWQLITMRTVYLQFLTDLAILLVPLKNRDQQQQISLQKLMISNLQTLMLLIRI